MFEKQQSTPNFTLFPIPSHNPLLSCSFDIPQPIILPPGTDPYALSNPDRHAKGRLDPLPALEVDPSAASRSEIITKMADLTPSEHAGRAFCETTTVSMPSHPLGNSGALTQHAVTDVVVIATRSKNTKSIQCDVCNITCNSEDVLTRHKEGKKHLKNLQKLSLSSAATKQTSPSVANASLDGDSYEKKHVLLSNISDVGCNSEDMFTEPLKGNRHVAQVASGGLCRDSLSNPTSVSAAPAQPSNCGTHKARDRANISKSVWCEVCNVGCTSDTVLSRHILGKRHLKNVKNLEQIVSQPSSPIASMATTVAKPVEDPRLRDGEIVNSEGGKPAWCEVCKASCSSNVLSRHISGKKHLKNLQNLEEVPVAPSTPVASVTTPPAGPVEATKGEIVNSKEGKSAWCELCRIGCNTYDMLNKHVSGKKHQKNMKKSEYLTGPCTAVVAEPSVTGPLQDSVNEGEVVTLESCKRKAKKSVASHEDLDTKRQKMIEGGAASGSLISCTLCNVVCNSPRAFTSHLAGQKHAAMALKQVKAGSNGQNMSSCSSSGSSYFLDDEELLQFEARCKELRMEKDMLKESQSKSFELIRSLESHARTLSETRSNDKKRIQDLERELSNCSQEIDYLQDLLVARDTEINNMSDYIHDLESKLQEKADLDGMVRSLGQEMKASNLERLALMEDLQNKKLELHNSILCIEKLEESMESMNLDLMALERSFFEAKKLQEEAAQEHYRMHELTKSYKLQMQDDARKATCLVEENKELREKLKTFETNTRIFLQEMNSKFPELLENHITRFSSSAVENASSTCGDILGAVVARMMALRTSDADSENKMKKLSCQMLEYELLVSQLKEQLREEKLKAKEEAEDLAQEMAELRYQLTGLLEEEYKRRACIEQRALQRITELEAQIEKEKGKTFAAIRGLPKA